MFLLLALNKKVLAGLKYVPYYFALEKLMKKLNESYFKLP